jgi:hypothetical protein
MPELARDRLARIRAKAPLLLDMAIAAIRACRIADELAQVARAARVGFDDGKQGDRDYGPGIRLRPALRRDRRRARLLREADTEIVFGADPDKPNEIVRRARRVDPLVRLHRVGTITGRHIDAAEILRGQLEAARSSLGGGAMSEIHVAPHQRMGQNDRQVDSQTSARIAVEAISAANRPVVIWVICGGTTTGYATFAHVANVKSAAMLKVGLDELARHYRLPGDDAPPVAA